MSKGGKGMSKRYTIYIEDEEYKVKTLPEILLDAVYADPNKNGPCTVDLAAPRCAKAVKKANQDKKLYWVQFVEQEHGNKIDTYFIAKNLAHLEEEIADILEVKLINDVQDLTT